MTLTDLLTICAEYAALGDSVQEQTEDAAIYGPDLDTHNANALKAGAEWLRKAATRVDDDLADEVAEAAEAMEEASS